LTLTGSYVLDTMSSLGLWSRW